MPLFLGKGSMFPRSGVGATGVAYGRGQSMGEGAGTNCVDSSTGGEGSLHMDMLAFKCKEKARE